mmetsp:Transcript_7264/g.21949  ORF Transcript_7264/g.21949 Transcript_7264/m.21949 type:complete len:226 (+) Transcript_7264:149-826(+)
MRDRLGGVLARIERRGGSAHDCVVVERVRDAVRAEHKQRVLALNPTAHNVGRCYHTRLLPASVTKGAAGGHRCAAAAPHALDVLLTRPGRHTATCRAHTHRLIVDGLVVHRHLNAHQLVGWGVGHAHAKHCARIARARHHDVLLADDGHDGGASAQFHHSRLFRAPLGGAQHVVHRHKGRGERLFVQRAGLGTLNHHRVHARQTAVCVAVVAALLGQHHAIAFLG